MVGQVPKSGKPVPTGETGRSGGRRLSDVQLRAQVLATARQMLERAGGLAVSLEHLSLEDVIRHAGVPKTSAYRLWPRKELFHIDLLCDLAGPSWQGTAAFDQETIALASSVVADNFETLSTVEGRRRVLREVIRQGARQNFEALIGSTEWRTYVALTATLLSQSDTETRDRISEALREAEQTFIRRMVLFYEDMSIVLGLKLKAPYGESWDVLAAIGAAVVEGLGLRQLIMPEVVNRTFSLDGPEGPEEWTLPAIGFMGIVETLSELDDDYNLADRLSRYVKRLTSRQTADPSLD